MEIDRAVDVLESKVALVGRELSFVTVDRNGNGGAEQFNRSGSGIAGLGGCDEIVVRGAHGSAEAEQVAECAGPVVLSVDCEHDGFDRHCGKSALNVANLSGFQVDSRVALGIVDAASPDDVVHERVGRVGSSANGDVKIFNLTETFGFYGKHADTRVAQFDRRRFQVAVML